ncbi:TRAP transporter small permease subunit [Undibacterium seohonense]|uniref:TRAP transporter small permease protein n=1 Tax=Undibacterium seohonense TaxID=1344950 RepID=A0ABR6X3K0_9BURK|nr:TRAP transporter small permease subunit [Undibacterium seohonense]MBC3807497.1 TRAP transporter small permease subunit [Undibacterium seohonense]
MQVLIALSKKIDGLNEKIGSAISWALLLAVLICTGNALIRYSFNNSSNGWLEIQWYLFGAVFLLAAPYTLRRNEHVRIDVIAGRFSKRTQVWIDLLGYVFFLMPMAMLILYLGTPYAIHSFTRQEMSSNAGGLIEWPAKLLIPLGFALLVLQGISEIIKRIGYLRGLVDASEFDKQAKTAQDEIDAIKLANQDKLAGREFEEQK